MFNDSPLKYTSSDAFLKDHDQITPFQNLLLVKGMKQELTVEAISEFIKETLG